MEYQFGKLKVGSRRSSALSFRIRAALVLFLLAFSSYLPTLFALTDTYSETFDNRQNEGTINGVDSWSVTKGPNASAVTQSSTTSHGSGKSLKVAGDEDAVVVARTAPMGSLTPTWIQYTVKPGMGSEAGTVPNGGIGAVCFNYTGDVLAASGKNWVSTGTTFDPDKWYKVLMKIDFSTKLYDLYVWPANVEKTPFVANKQNLQFIDGTISSISELGFKGVFNPAGGDDTFVDDLVVHFVQRLEVVTPLQTIVKDTISDPIMIQLQNANAEPQTAWEDITVDVLSSSSTGEFSLSTDPWQPVTQIIISEGSQGVTVYYKDSNPGKPVLNIKENPDRGFQEALHQLTVVGEIKLFDVQATTPQIAGRPFQITVTAKDEDGTVNQSYNGPVRIFANYINPASGAMTVSPDTFNAFNQGVAQITMTYPDAGSITIVVEDIEDREKNGASGQILFSPAKLTVSTEEAAYHVSEEFPLTITALNEGDAVTTNYKGPAVLSSLAVNPPGAAGGTFSPATISAEQFRDGKAEIPATYDHWGTIQIAASDQTNQNIKGQSTPVVFSPHAVGVKVTPSASRDYFYTGENFEVAIQVLDALGQPIKNFDGVVQISSEPDLGLPGEYQFMEFDGGSKTYTLSASSAGNYIIDVKSMEYNLDARSIPIKVQSATVEIISTSAPIGSTEIEIQLLDERGKRITRENDVTVSIVVYEEDGDNSFFSSSLNQPVVFRNGVAKIVIGDNEAETLKIGVETKYGFQVKTGTVTFGKIGKSGIGALMMWESKDDDAGKDDETEEQRKKREEASLEKQ